MFTHNSKTADNEPAWSSVDKTALPRIAFADMGEPDKKSTWSYPHHWVKGGTKKDDNGIWTDGTLYLHEGGLKAAWAAAHGARSGQRASQAVIDHLQRHRKALGLDTKSEGGAAEVPWLIDQGWLRMISAVLSGEEGLAPPEKAAASDESYKIGNVGVIAVKGPIFSGMPILKLFFGGRGPEEIAHDLKAFAEDDEVERIVLDFDSPGGQVTGISELADQIRGVEKPVTAFVSGSALSAAYWLASAADEIIAVDTALLGSIGVVASYRKQDDDVIEIVSSNAPYKRPDPSTDEGRKKIQEVLDGIAEVFVTKVAGYRGVDTAFVLEHFGRGGVLVGRNALDVGMIDAIGTFNNVLKGGKEMEVTREMLEKEHPDLIKQIAEEAKRELVEENKKLQMEMFKKDLEGMVGTANVGLFVKAYEEPTKENFMALAGVVAKLLETVDVLGAAKGSPKTEKDIDPDLDAIAALAKEKGLSLVDARVEFEKMKGGK